MQLRETSEGVVIKVKVTPNSSRNAVLDTPDHLTVKLMSPPVEGKANKELLRFLAKRMHVAPSSITIVRGHSSREKTLLVSGVDAATARERLQQD